MDDTPTELESELRTLRPRNPSAGLLARIGRELADNAASSVPIAQKYATATTFHSWKWAGWQLAAAVAVTLTVSLGVWRYQQRAISAGSPAVAAGPTSPTIARSQPSTAPSNNQRYRPVGATNVLYDMKDDGPAYLADDTPARQVRYRYVDTYTWKAPASNASLKWSVPREEVRVLPASLH